MTDEERADDDFVPLEEAFQSIPITDEDRIWALRAINNRLVDELNQMEGRIEELEDIVATHCDPCGDTRVAKVISECYANFCERKDRE